MRSSSKNNDKNRTTKTTQQEQIGCQKPHWLLLGQPDFGSHQGWDFSVLIQVQTGSVVHSDLSS